MCVCASTHVCVVKHKDSIPSTPAEHTEIAQNNNELSHPGFYFSGVVGDRCSLNLDLLSTLQDIYFTEKKDR